MSGPYLFSESEEWCDTTARILLHSAAGRKCLSFDGALKMAGGGVTAERECGDLLERLGVDGKV
jgi:hypothetical protein